MERASGCGPRRSSPWRRAAEAETPPLSAFAGPFAAVTTMAPATERTAR